MADCVFKSLGDCIHPIHRGKTDDARCAACSAYVGSPRGLGDIVHSIAETTGAAYVARFVSRGDCGGCARRRAALNAAVPFTDKPREG